MNTLTGYSKSTLTDSYLLTAAGGHKAISDFVTLDTAQTISGVKTFSSQQKFTVAAGTAPFQITSDTKVTNLNADCLDDYHETSFFRKRDMSASNVNFNDYFTNGVYVNTTGNGTGNSNVPSTYGYLLAFYGAGSNSYYGGAQIHIGTNGNLQTRAHWAHNWSTWKTILDSSNSSVSGDGGSTWGSSVTVKINGTSKTLTIPSNPLSSIKTLTFSSGTFAATTYNGSTNVTVNVPSTFNHIGDATSVSVTSGTVKRKVIVTNIKSEGYISRASIGLSNPANQFSPVIIGVGTNDAGTAYTDYYFHPGGSITDSKGNTYAKTSQIPTIPNLSLGTTTGTGNAVTSITVNGHKITLNKGTTFSTSGHTHSHLVSGATLSGSDHAVALKTYFTNNYSSIPRNSLNTYRSSAMSNTSQYFGYFVEYHNDAPYGGFYVAHYDKPYYVGISNGTFTQHQLAKITDITKTQVGLSNVQNTAFYQRATMVNGVNWSMAGTANAAAFTIYAPTTGGTAGYILKSNKDAAPTWIAQSDISAGKLGGYEESKFLRSKGWVSAGSINDFSQGIYGTDTKTTDVPKDANGNNLTYSTVLSFDAQVGSGYGKVQFYVKSAQLYYRHYWDSKWYDWYQIALKSHIPTKVSQLQNDSGYLTSHQSLENYVTLNSTQTITGAKSFEGNLIIKRSPSSCIWYRNSSNTLWGLLGFSAENTLTVWKSDASTSYEVYHKGNLGLVGANGTTGLIKNGSTVTTTTGLTACPIINGVPYYKELSPSGVTANTYKTYAEKWNSTAMFQQLKIPQFTINEYGILTNATYTATPIIRTHYIGSNQTWTNDNLSFINVFAVIPGVTLTLPGASIENCGKLIFAKKAYQGSAAYISGYITACNSYGTSASTRSVDLINSSIFVCMYNGSSYSWVHFYCG